jgi:hypothetical protein
MIPYASGSGQQTEGSTVPDKFVTPINGQEPAVEEELDLAAQLELLLAEIDAREPGLVTRDAAPATAVEPPAPPAATPAPVQQPSPAVAEEEHPAPPESPAVLGDVRAEAVDAATATATADATVAHALPPSPASSTLPAPPASPDALDPTPDAPSPQQPLAEAVDDALERQLADVLAQARSLQTMASDARRPESAEPSPSPAPTEANGEAEASSGIDADFLASLDKLLNPAATELPPATDASATADPPQATEARGVPETCQAPTPPAMPAPPQLQEFADDAEPDDLKPSALAVGPDTDTDTEAAAPEAEPAEPVERDPAAAATALTEDELAAQLQAILDVASANTNISSAGPAPAPQADVAAAVDVPAVSGDDDETIKALDEILAEEADAAIAGEFETIEDVLVDPPAPRVPLMANLPPAGDVTPDADEVSSDDALAAAPADDLDDALSGDFETPEQLLETRVGEAATTVADNPQQATAMSSAGRGPAAPGGQKTGRGRFRWPMPSPVVLDLTYHAFAAINAPIRKLSPEMRSTVGYIAVMNLLLSACLVAYGVLF